MSQMRWVGDRWVGSRAKKYPRLSQRSLRIAEYICQYYHTLSLLWDFSATIREFFTFLLQAVGVRI